MGDMVWQFKIFAIPFHVEVYEENSINLCLEMFYFLKLTALQAIKYNSVVILCGMGFEAQF